MYNLIENVHTGLTNPCSTGEINLIKGNYKYYHYACDGFKDMGWGCGYRTLQSICSWVQITKNSQIKVPSLPEIQNILYNIEDKPASFVGSRDWIGSVEVCLVIDHLYDVPCKIIHLKNKNDLYELFPQIEEHFKTKCSPIMMGGDQDCSSKGIFGTFRSENNIFLLIVDPHFVGTARSPKELQTKSWVKWQELSDFSDSSFYNLCIPQLCSNSDQNKKKCYIYMLLWEYK